MAIKRYILPDQESISISGSAADKLIRRGDGSAALLYIYMLRNKGNMEIERAQMDLGYTEQQVYDAMSLLCAVGLVSGGGVKEKYKPENEELPDYTSEEIIREMDSSTDFSLLVHEVQCSMGKPLITNDLKILLGLYQHLNMPSEVILLLISYCIEEHQDKYGKGKIPTMRGVEKVAYTWVRNGILTLEEAMKYIKRRKEQKSAAGEFARAMNIKGELTKTQKEYIYKWMDMGFNTEAIEEAYERTVKNTGQFKINYMNTIVTNWHEKGVHTIDEIQSVNSKKNNGKNKAVIMPDRDEIERNKRFLEELKRQQ